MINLGAFTDLTLAHMAAPGLLIGDGIAPAHGGWVQGAPNQDKFVGYTVVSVDGAVPVLDSVGFITPEWEVPVALRSYGGARQQCDFQANAVRARAEGMGDLTFGDPAYKVLGTRWRALGGVTRNDQLDPPIWYAYDTVVLTCGRVTL